MALAEPVQTPSPPPSSGRPPSYRVTPPNDDGFHDSLNAYHDPLAAVTLTPARRESIHGDVNEIGVVSTALL